MPERESKERTRVLVADDDRVVLRLFESQLTKAGFETVTAADGLEAQARMNEDVDVALLDLFMPGASGLEVLKHIRREHPQCQVVVISATGKIHDAVEAMREGAFQYLTKPVEAEDLVAHIRQAARTVALERDNRELRQAVACPMPSPTIVARADATRKLLSQVEKVARLDSTVLVTGESGTGKTTLARRIHQLGPRSDGPFVAVSCAALPRDLIEAELFGHERGAFTGAVETRPGRAEMADGGTLFLDEIGDLPLELQPKLLTFLQDRTVRRIGGNAVRQVDVRVIAATHQDLQAMCEQRRFREDLYFRLNVLRLHAPALRERKEDLAALIDDVLERVAESRGVRAYTLAPDARQRLLGYAWPGNLRELENVLERASAFCANGEIGAELLDLDATPGGNGATKPAALAGRTMAEIERQAIVETLRACDGNKAATARSLGVCEKTIYNKLKRLGL